MFKYLSISLLIFSLNGESTGVPTSLNGQSKIISSPLLRSKSELSSELGSHVMDFVELIDVDKLFGVAIGYMNDDEVLGFLAFVLSSQFKELIWEFQSIGEFKEILAFLSSKGYESEFLIDYINAALNLPHFEKPKMLSKNGKGISGLIEDIVATLPIEDMRKLFEIKLQTSSEIAELFEIINSEEFIVMLRKLQQNPKSKEFKAIFEGYGFDFKYLCALAQEIFGDYYQGIFCE